MWNLITAIWTLFILHLLADNGLSQGPVKNLKIAYSAISGSSFPLWIAKDAKLFEKYGLSADLVYIPSSSLSLQAMLGGNIHLIATASAPTILQARIQGGDAVLIGATSNTVTSFFMVTSDISNPRDLKGKTLGVSRFGAFSDTVLRYALKKWGFEVGRDVTVLQMGGIPEILAGMKAGLVSGGPLSPPTDLRARREGYKELVDFGQILEYPQTSIAASRRYLQSSREEVRAYLKATIESVHVMHTNKNLAMTIFGKYTRTPDKEIQEAAYNTYVNKTEKLPYIKLNATKVAIDLLAEKDPKFRNARPEEFIDNSVVKEIEDSGFVEKLYGRKN
jgi:ABC-type nitrate/sulfonate/bicarbonate transport system substrate-binding protein